MPFLGRYSSRYKEHPTAVRQREITVQDVRLGADAPPRAVASQKFGSATVTCCLQGAHSKWGKHQQKDAAILHFMINASQPPNFKLEHFELKTEFTTTTPQESTCIGALRGRSLAEPELYLIDVPSPKWVGGTPTTRRRARELNIQPQIEAAGGGGSLGGYTRSEEGEVQKSWIFRSGWDADQQGVYNVASWIWEANADNPQVEDRGALYGALALRYPTQPFYISSSVQGKLVKENSLHIFKLTPRQEQSQACITRLTPAASDQDLEAEIRRLEEQVVQLNLQPAASK